jgi:hypothetical protein
MDTEYGTRRVDVAITIRARVLVSLVPHVVENAVNMTPEDGVLKIELDGSDTPPTREL